MADSIVWNANNYIPNLIAVYDYILIQYYETHDNISNVTKVSFIS